MIDRGWPFGGAIAAGLLLAAGALAVEPEQVWQAEGLDGPESAVLDAGGGVIYVSNVNGEANTADGNGYISKLALEGEILDKQWVTGLNAPKGLRSVGNTLWVADIDEVVGIDIGSGKITSRVKVEGATFLNDLATAPDGTIYTSDSSGLRIYATRDGKSSVFVEGADVVEQPNGLLVDGSRLILGTIGPAPTPGAPPPGRGQGAPRPSGHLYAFDLKTRQRTQLTTENVGGIDGIEPDGSGGVLVTDVIGQRLLHVAKSGQVRVLAKFTAGGADFGYVSAKRIAVVPFLFENRVTAYDLTNSLK
jgi:DNA-binding beta-propeller fold protein YncE